MSISSIIDNKKEFENRRLLNQIKRIQNQFPLFDEFSARSENIKMQLSTLSDYDEIMNDIISYPNNLLNVYEQHFSSIQNRINFITEDIAILYSLINEKYSKYEQFKIDFQDSTIALKKRIYQKLAIANFSSINFTKVFVENFCNNSNIDTTVSTLNIDSNNELATLPISSKTIQEIKDIVITNISNGISGNVKDGSNANLFFTIDSKDETLFEYNRLDEGPCKLGLKYSLKTKSVINEVVIKTNVINGISKFTIEDVIFESSNGQTISIKKLINTNEQKMVVNFYDSFNSKGFNIKHLPIECVSVSFIFVQNEYSEITLEQKKQFSKRKVYSIGISEIQLITNAYNTEGVIVSKNLSIAENMYMASYVCETFPQIGDYFKLEMSIDDNSGLGTTEIKQDSGTYIGENTENIKYKFKVLKLNRVDNDIKKTTNDLIVNYTLLNKAIFNTNDYFNFNDTFVPDSLIVGRPDFLIRSSSKQSKTIKTFLSTDWTQETYNNKNYWTASIDLNINEINIDKIKIQSPSKMSIIQSSLSQVKFLYDVETKPITPITVKWYGEIENTNIYENNNRYFVEITEPFEPNKSKIKISNKVTTNYKNEILSKQTDGTFKLSYNNIGNHIEIKGMSSSDYTIEKTEGIITLTNNQINEIEVTYTYIGYTEINDLSYDFWYKDKKLRGLSFLKENLVSEKIVKQISLENADNFFLPIKNNLVLNSFVFKNLFDNYEMVDYVNGNTEFFGESNNQKDSIPDEEIDQDYPVIAFRLSKPINYSESNVIKDVDNFFQNGAPDKTKAEFKLTVFSNSSEIVSEGFVCESDLVRNQILQTLYVINLALNKTTIAVYSLESKIGMFFANKTDLILRNANINYRFTSNTSDKNLISINKKTGKVYFNKKVKKAFQLEYQIIPLDVSYSIYDSIDFSYANNKLQYNVPQKNQYQEVNNHLCVYFAKEIASIEIANQLQYFSPLIYSLKLGFN